MTGDVSLSLFNLDATRLASWEDAFRGLSRARSALRARVEELLQHVHPIERDIIELYYFQGVSQTGISAIIGVTQQAVSHRLRSAFRRLIFLLEQPEIPATQMREDLQTLVGHLPRAVDVLCDYARTSSQLATASNLGLSQQRVSEIFTGALDVLDAHPSLDAICYTAYFRRMLEHKNVYVYQDQRRAVRRRRRRARGSREEHRGHGARRQGANHRRSRTAQ